jgi:AcrR family transcriptional regulator
MTDSDGAGPRNGRPAPRRAAVPGSATEDRLVEATLRCLAREGLAGTTARHITGEADVNLAAITYHFGGKDQLVDRALVRAVRRLVDPVVAVLDDPARDPRAATRAVADAVRLVEEAVDAGGPPCALYAEAAARSARSETVRHGWDETHVGLRAALRRRLVDLQGAGTVAGHHDAAALAARLVAVIVGALVGATAASTADRGIVRGLYESALDQVPRPRHRAPPR